VIKALNLKKVLTKPDYYGPNKKRNDLEKALVTLLQTNIDETHSKAKTLQKNLWKHQQHIFTFYGMPMCRRIIMEASKLSET